MERKTRIALKSLTWQLMGLVSMSGIGFVVTGSLTASGGIALISAALGYVCYFLHEFVWSKIAWGRDLAPRP